MENNKTTFGILFMLINTLALAVLDISAKTLRMSLDANLIVFLYKTSLFILILPWVLREGLSRLKTKKIHLHIMRSVLSTVAAILFFHGISLVNMADAAALENIQYVIVAIIGMTVFHEQCTKTKIIAILLGFLGAVIVVKPSTISMLFTSSFEFEQYNPNHWFIILAICLWSSNTIIVKLLGHTEHNKTQMFYLLFFAFLCSAPTALFNFQLCEIAGYSVPLLPTLRSFESLNFSINTILLLSVMATCYFIHGVAYFNALKTELSVVIPFRYTKLLFSGLLGYYFFNETPQNISFIGYFLIIFSGSLLFRAQILKKRNINIMKKGEKLGIHTTDNKFDTSRVV